MEEVEAAGVMQQAEMMGTVALLEAAAQGASEPALLLSPPPTPTLTPTLTPLTLTPPNPDPPNPDPQP